MSEADQVKKKPGAPPRHDKNSGLQQYPDGTWGINIYLHGRRVRKKIGLLTEARAYREELKAAERRGEVGLAPKAQKRRTLGDWIDVYLSTPRGPTDTAFANQWKDALGRHYPEQFTLEMLRTWCHTRLEAGAEIASVRRRMDPLRATYSEILRSGEIGEHQSPFRDRKALRLPKINNERDSYLKLASWPSVAAAFGPAWWPYCEFAVLTTMRLGNQIRLRWDAIDWESSLAILHVTKNGKKQRLPLSGVALELLRQQQARQLATGPASEWCWPNSKGSQLNPAHFRQRVWGPAFAKAGLKKMGAGRNGLTWHDLRGTGPTLLVQAGESLFALQELLNHEDLRTTQRYLAHGKTDVRDAVERLADITRPAALKTPQGSEGVGKASVTSENGREYLSSDGHSTPVKIRFSSN